MRIPLTTFLLCLGVGAALADNGRTGRPIEPVYDRIAQDLQAGRPLVIAAYYGLWFDHNQNPDRNLNWGTYYGHARMMARVTRDRHIRRLYRHRHWQRVYADSADVDPLRTLVYHQRVKPNGRWRAAGVTTPFDAYLVMQAFASREEAAIRMTRTLRQSADHRLTLDDGVVIDVGAAQIAGYFGHNLFYDYDNFEWDGLRSIPGAPTAAKGVFAVGCKTGRVPGFNEVLGPNVFALLYSKTLMAAEGYSTLALTDGVLRHLDGRQMVAFGNRTYAYFQRLGKPDRRVGKPFVSHEYLLFPRASKAKARALDTGP